MLLLEIVLSFTEKQRVDIEFNFYINVNARSLILKHNWNYSSRNIVIVKIHLYLSSTSRYVNNARYDIKTAAWQKKNSNISTKVMKYVTPRERNENHILSEICKLKEKKLTSLINHGADIFTTAICSMAVRWCRRIEVRS